MKPNLIRQTLDMLEAVEAETTAGLSDDQKAAKQALRDITNQDNPFDISWPSVVV
jgi:secreted Zn-dependent insulinase-like peptidase